MYKRQSNNKNEMAVVLGIKDVVRLLNIWYFMITLEMNGDIIKNEQTRKFYLTLEAFIKEVYLLAGSEDFLNKYYDKWLDKINKKNNKILKGSFIKGVL